VAKTAVLRQQFWKYYDKTSSYYPMLDKNHKRDFLLEHGDSFFQSTNLKTQSSGEYTIPFKLKKPSVGDYSISTPGSFKTFFWNNVVNYPETF